MSRSDQVNDASLRALSGIRRHVVILSLRGAAITDAAMVEIGRLPNLVRLEVPMTGVTVTDSLIILFPLLGLSFRIIFPGFVKIQLF